jgi:hypothetical protein
MERMILLLNPAPQQENQLRQFLQDVQDPSSPLYHRWLSPDDFGTRFGASQDDVDSITTWLARHGFRVDRSAHNRLMIQFSGTAEAVLAAFHTEIHSYVIAGRTYYANATDPVIPAAMAPVVRGFVSLHNFPRRMMYRYAGVAQITRSLSRPTPQLNLSDGSHALTPYDFATIYNVAPLWSKGIDGSGQSIAIIGRAWVDISQVAAFRNIFGLPQNQPTVLALGGVLEQGDNEVMEAELDLQWAGAVAKGANVIFVQSGSTNTADGVDLSSFYAVENNVAPIISSSFGGCEPQANGDAFYKLLWSQAAAQGISVFVAAGDNGSAGCDDPSGGVLASGGLAVNAIASTPDNVAVGGTQFNDGENPSAYWTPTTGSNGSSAISYIPEAVWNESSNTPSAKSILAGSGGTSQIFATPIWQTGNGVPSVDPGTADQHHRYVPDVSLNSAGHTPYAACNLGDCIPGTNTSVHLVYGTSVASPAFAGIMALVNQQAGSIQGNPNFHFYPLSHVAGIYHDITTGTNAVPCSAGTGCSAGTMIGFNAGAGFDLATGWGSVDANALVSNWSSISFQGTTITGSVSPTTFQHGTNVTLSASVTASSGTPTGAVSAYVTNGSTTQLGAATLENGSVSGLANGFPGGTGILFFRYGGDGVYGSSTSAGVPVTITPEPSSVTATPSPTNPHAGDPYFYISASVVGQSGVGVATGTVSAQLDGKYITSDTLDRTGSTIVPLNNAPSSPGTYTYTLSYSGDASFNPSSTNVTVTVGKADTTTIARCGQTLVVGTDVQCAYQTVYMVGPGVSGTVQFYDNGVPVGATFPASSIQQTANLGKLTVGSHSLKAVYSGDDNYYSSTSDPTTATVVASGTMQVSIAGFGYSVAPGSPVTVNAYAIPGQQGPNENGTLTLFDGSTPIASYAAPGNFWSISPSFTLNTAVSPMSLGNHVLSAKYSGDSFWPDASSGTFTLQIANPDFTITGLDPTTVTRGASAYLYPTIRGIGGLTGSVNLTCAGAPAESTCSITQSYPIDSTPSVVITTTASHAAMLQRHPGWTRFGGLFAFALLGLSVSVSSRKRKNVLIGIVFVLAIAAGSCGGGGTNSATSSGGGGGTTDLGTPVGTYQLTITGTYGSGATAITHSFPLQLTVK